MLLMMKMMMRRRRDRCYQLDDDDDEKEEEDEDEDDDDDDDDHDDDIHRCCGHLNLLDLASVCCFEILPNFLEGGLELEFHCGGCGMWSIPVGRIPGSQRQDSGHLLVSAFTD